MFKNYLTIAFRSLKSNLGFSLINIFGLAIGMAATILIALWVNNEVGYDRFHQNVNQIYVAFNKSLFEGEMRIWRSTPSPLAPALKQEFPEVKYAVRVDYNQKHLAEYQGKKLQADGYNADPDFLKIFSFPLLSGNVNDCLAGNDHLIVTETFARKLFGTADVVGKLIKLDNKYDFTIGGVLKDMPANTRFTADFIAPWAFLQRQYGPDRQLWGNNSIRTYVQLLPNTNLESFNRKVSDITIRHSNQEEDNRVFMYPMKDYYLQGTFKNGKLEGGHIEIVRLFTVVACFILLIACINFMNLSTARGDKRAKEVGVRKAIGALKQALIGQFLLESVLIAAMAGALGLLAAQLALPYFNQLIQTQLAMPYANGWFIAGVIGFILITGLLAGCYPALYLSSFKAVAVLKGAHRKVSALITPRKVLVVTQFTFAVVMIVSTIIIRRQIQYAQDRDNGYEQASLVYVSFSGDIEKNKQLIKSELINSGAASAVSVTSSNMVSGDSNTWGVEWQGKPTGSKITFDRMATLGDFGKTMKLKFISGRDIDPAKFPTDSTACLINESAMRIMNFKNPIGQLVENEGLKWHIVGVFKDFVWQSPFEAMSPMLVTGPTMDWSNCIQIRLNPNQSVSASLQKAEAVFKKYNPAFPVTLSFVDQEYQHKFAEQQRTGKLAGIFALLTILISCLGLFGLAAYMAASRTKEIGVRKVLGASVANVTALISVEFLKPILLSVALATPIAWIMMYRWLQNYSYRMQIEWWVFAVGGFMAVVIALLTVSYQSVKAAVANPVKSLRSE
ncbi:ABC transporter permease [Mucilaginibacter sp. CSA2-8R]|uniref:ABC transporter permease n=1 Tax=Mucilaginibacter sp. CSA2-8R TaxID=3141542 RepID=UPI00315DD76B